MKYVEKSGKKISYLAYDSVYNTVIKKKILLEFQLQF